MGIKSYLRERKALFILLNFKSLSCWVDRKEIKKRGLYRGEFLPCIVSSVIVMQHLLIKDDRTQINIHPKQSHCVVISYA